MGHDIQSEEAADKRGVGNQRRRGQQDFNRDLLVGVIDGQGAGVEFVGAGVKSESRIVTLANDVKTFETSGC